MMGGFYRLAIPPSIGMESLLDRKRELIDLP
jgi:hypothetical protein